MFLFSLAIIFLCCLIYLVIMGLHVVAAASLFLTAKGTRQLPVHGQCPVHALPSTLSHHKCGSANVTLKSSHAETILNDLCLNTNRYG